MDELNLKRIASVLLGESEVKNKSHGYFAEVTLSPTDISVEVEGVGKLEFPLTVSCIEKLVRVSSKAKFGLRDSTILDDNVRNTQEITREKLNVSILEPSLKELMTKTGKKLGLHERSVLAPHLHNMLIYSRGQFFEMHQDTEKMGNMVATLVIVLPSSHIGGDLVIHQKDKKHVFSTENFDEQQVKCIAFYADCLHKIEKVKTGYRVALTYNLVLNPTNLSNSKCDRRLKGFIQKYFSSKQSQSQHKLVYFLSHEYSEHGLKWGLLKGNDWHNAASFVDVAKDLELVPHLALVEIHHLYETEDDFDRRRKNPKLGSMLESDTKLSYWVDASNNKLNYKELEIKDDEICWTKDIESFQPYKTEYEGYKGNYGQTKDFWYRRAAVVLWSQSDQTKMKFGLGNSEALDDLLELTQSPGNEQQILDVICKAEKHLYVDCKTNAESCFIKLAPIAIYLHDEDLAFEVLSHFPRSVVSVSTAELLAKLQTKYGVDWCFKILKKWEETGANCDIDKVDAFVHIFMQNNGSIQVAEHLLEKQSVVKDPPDNAEYYPRTISLPERLQKLKEMFKACTIIRNVPILLKFFESVKSNPRKYPFLKLVDFFLELKDGIPRDFFVHFLAFKDYIAKAVNAEFSQGKHSNDDWSLKVRLVCSCEHCAEALQFLASKTEMKKVMPLREKLRKHVTFKMKGLFLPIDISVERTGSPHKLIIEKKVSMHEEAHARFKEVVRCHKLLIDHKF